MLVLHNSLSAKLSLIAILCFIGVGCSTGRDLMTKPDGFNSDTYLKPSDYGIKNSTEFFKKPKSVIASSKFIPARVDGGMQTLMNNVRYPYKSRSQFQEGKVFMKLYIDQTGKVRYVHILKSPDKRLGQYSVYAVKHTDFLPATLNKSPVKSTRLIMFNFNFKLDNEVRY